MPPEAREVPVERLGPPTYFREGSIDDITNKKVLIWAAIAVLVMFVMIAVPVFAVMML
jgi:hypothetical protein